ncbi:hypothetical protein PINS_up006433 [Pythium insidiosum]|nr:hypothetical protein PINS_up006433 [Pythium insidiosum]
MLLMEQLSISTYMFTADVCQSYRLLGCEGWCQKCKSEEKVGSIRIMDDFMSKRTRLLQTHGLHRCSCATKTRPMHENVSATRSKTSRKASTVPAIR